MLLQPDPSWLQARMQPFDIVRMISRRLASLQLEGMHVDDVLMMMAMIEHRVDVDRCCSNGLTALHIASGANQTAAMEVLIEAGADIEVPWGGNRNTRQLPSCSSTAIRQYAGVTRPTNTVVTYMLQQPTPGGSETRKWWTFC